MADAAKSAQQSGRRRGYFVFNMGNIPDFHHLSVHFFQQGCQAQPPGQKEGHVHTCKTGGKRFVLARQRVNAGMQQGNAVQRVGRVQGGSAA